MAGACDHVGVVGFEVEVSLRINIEYGVGAWEERLPADRASSREAPRALSDGVPARPRS